MNQLDSIDLMREFWISQNGEVPGGPFTLEQIGSMWRSGAVYATAQVCESGSETWLPVTSLRRDFPAAFGAAAAVRNSSPVSAPVAASYHPGIFRILLLVLGGLGGHNFYAGDVGAGLQKLFLLVVAVVAPILAGDLGLLLSWGIAVIVFIVLVIELIRGESIPSGRS
jgi:TM2 domain-containing membrane protein YozV